MSPPPRLVVPALCAGFVLLLLVLTLTSAPSPAPPEVRHAATAALPACRAALAARVPGARFPFAPRAEARGEARYLLHGTVDAGPAGGAVRRNFACVVRFEAGRGYVADSVHVWQSH